MNNKSQQKSPKPKNDRLSQKETEDAILFECAWEVCNQVGGIYTVIRSKIPSVVDKWNDNNYILLGPYFKNEVSAVFEPIEDYEDALGKTVLSLREDGLNVYYGYWLVSGRPRVILFDPQSAMSYLSDIKYHAWEQYGISFENPDTLIDQVISFGHQVTEFFKKFTDFNKKQQKILAHFHEWMAGLPIPGLRKHNLPVNIIFTTHATILGRYLAMNDPVFYDHLPFYDWAKEAKHFNIETQVQLERAAAHGAHLFSTVSNVTATECSHLLGRQPDIILPNGLNIKRFEVLHEFQNIHLIQKEKIHEFVMGHFFPSYSFDLDNTLYFFTSGRFEYQNKGFDITLEALARLNWKMKQQGLNKTVITFFITRQPYHSINPQVLNSRVIMDEIRKNCDEIQNNVGKSLFYSVTESSESKLPDLNSLVDDYLRLKLRRTLMSWKSEGLPPVVTHNLVDDTKDEILSFLRSSNLVNGKDDKVKVIYHPDFITPANPLLRMEYYQFVRGCHLGIFPSYYEPWGYTPLECIASGVPTVTSDLAGFGDFVSKTTPEMEKKGVFVLNRKYKDRSAAAEQLSEILLGFVQLDRRDRISIRNKVESGSVRFGWRELGRFYEQAYKKLMKI